MIQPPTISDSTDIQQRFANAGIVPPADRAAGTYASGQRLLAMVHWLRQPRSVAAEPSNTFSLVSKGLGQ